MGDDVVEVLEHSLKILSIVLQGRGAFRKLRVGVGPYRVARECIAPFDG